MRGERNLGRKERMEKGKERKREMHVSISIYSRKVLYPVSFFSNIDFSSNYAQCCPFVKKIKLSVKAKMV